MKSKSLKAKSFVPNENVFESPVMSQEAFTRQAVNFFRENDILTDYDLNTMVLSVYMASPKIKNVEIFIDRHEHIISVYAYLSRWNYLFGSKKKIIDQIVADLQPITSKNYTLNDEMKLDRKYDSKEKEKEENN